VTLELTRSGEMKVEEGLLEKMIRKDLKIDETHPIFIPALSYPKNGNTVTIHLLEGYVFVASGLPETAYFALERKFYINKVMSTKPHGMRVLSVISNSHITGLRKKLKQLTSSDIEVNTPVRVIEGNYASLEGVVILLQGNDAFVKVELRTLNLIVQLPRVFLEATS